MTGPHQQIHHRTVFTLLLAAALGTLVPACSSTTSPTGIATSTSSAGSAPAVIGGRVIDNVQRPVVGAKVDILDSTLAGQSVPTDDSGKFAFSGPITAGAVSLRVSKAGYATSPVTWRPSDSTGLVVLLRPLTTLTIQGPYQLTFTADASCAGIPLPVRMRSYTASVSMPNPSFPYATITLSGATFAPGYSELGAALGSDAVRFSVFSVYADNVWGDSEPIIERLDSSSYVSFEGTATATVTDANAPVDASFDGTIAYCSAAVDPTIPNFPPTCAIPPVQCKSPQNRLSFTPR
jgi:hypothetical protein